MYITVFRKSACSSISICCRINSGGGGSSGGSGGAGGGCDDGGCDDRGSNSSAFRSKLAPGDYIGLC